MWLVKKRSPFDFQVVRNSRAKIENSRNAGKTIGRMCGTFSTCFSSCTLLRCQEPVRNSGVSPQPPAVAVHVQGYLGYKKPCAPTSVGPRFLKLRKREQKPVGPRFLQLRKRTKAVGPRFLKFKKTDERGRSVFVTGPERVHVLY